MKVLGIVAGRHNGNSEILVKEALLACQEAGAEVKMINLFDYHIEHCIGCESCESRCPFGVKIAERMLKTKAFFE